MVTYLRGHAVQELLVELVFLQRVLHLGYLASQDHYLSVDLFNFVRFLRLLSCLFFSSVKGWILISKNRTANIKERSMVSHLDGLSRLVAIFLEKFIEKRGVLFQVLFSQLNTLLLSCRDFLEFTYLVSFNAQRVLFDQETRFSCFANLWNDRRTVAAHLDQEHFALFVDIFLQALLLDSPIPGHSDRPGSILFHWIRLHLADVLQIDTQMWGLIPKKPDILARKLTTSSSLSSSSRMTGLRPAFIPSMSFWLWVSFSWTLSVLFLSRSRAFCCFSFSLKMKISVSGGIWNGFSIWSWSVLSKSFLVAYLLDLPALAKDSVRTAAASFDGLGQ